MCKRTKLSKSLLYTLKIKVPCTYFYGLRDGSSDTEWAIIMSRTESLWFHFISSCLAITSYYTSICVKPRTVQLKCKWQTFRPESNLNCNCLGDILQWECMIQQAFQFLPFLLLLTPAIWAGSTIDGYDSEKDADDSVTSGEEAELNIAPSTTPSQKRHTTGNATLCSWGSD